MDNLPSPQQTIRLSNLQNFDLHVLVGLSAYAALLQLARQENVRSLRRYSWQGMQPPETLPRSSRVASLLFPVPVSLRIRGLLRRPLIQRVVRVPSPELDGDNSR